MAHLDLLIHKNYDFDHPKGFELSKETTPQGREHTNKPTLVSTLLGSYSLRSKLKTQHPGLGVSLPSLPWCESAPFHAQLASVSWKPWSAGSAELHTRPWTVVATERYCSLVLRVSIYCPNQDSFWEWKGVFLKNMSQQWVLTRTFSNSLSEGFTS